MAIWGRTGWTEVGPVIETAVGAEPRRRLIRQSRMGRVLPLIKRLRYGGSYSNPVRPSGCSIVSIAPRCQRTTDLAALTHWCRGCFLPHPDGWRTTLMLSQFHFTIGSRSSAVVAAP